jgi:hypothetical protein
LEEAGPYNIEIQYVVPIHKHYLATLRLPVCVISPFRPLVPQELERSVWLTHFGSECEKNGPGKYRGRNLLSGKAAGYPLGVTELSASMPCRWSTEDLVDFFGVGIIELICVLKIMISPPRESACGSMKMASP